MKFSGPFWICHFDPVKKKTALYCINGRSSAGHLQEVARQRMKTTRILYGLGVGCKYTAVVERSNQVSIVSPIGINHDVLSILYGCIFLRHLSFVFFFFISDQMPIQVSGCISQLVLLLYNHYRMCRISRVRKHEGGNPAVFNRSIFEYLTPDGDIIYRVTWHQVYSRFQ